MFCSDDWTQTIYLINLSALTINQQLEETACGELPLDRHHLPFQLWSISLLSSCRLAIFSSSSMMGIHLFILLMPTSAMNMWFVYNKLTQKVLLIDFPCWSNFDRTFFYFFRTKLATEWKFIIPTSRWHSSYSQHLEQKDIIFKNPFKPLSLTPLLSPNISVFCFSGNSTQYWSLMLNTIFRNTCFVAAAALTLPKTLEANKDTKKWTEKENQFP